MLKYCFKKTDKQNKDFNIWRRARSQDLWDLII